MKHIPVKLNQGQYLSQVDPFKTKGIPTDTIIHKVIPGCGATTLEIEYTKRNSIIILPNVPVIENKVAEYNRLRPNDERIIGIHKKIDVSTLDDYINSGATYKKILTTPEGFISKVLLAFENDIETMKKDYFLLIDECERIVTDVSYRGSITAPISWFFQFKNKAMVSATTLQFSHAGFSNFNHYRIEPTYNYQKSIDVINTNNVIESLQMRLSKLAKNDPIFIFVNSIETITAIIAILDIKDESHVYCSGTSVAKLITKKNRNGFSTLNLDHLAKYNFLTSRYFSAFDIKLPRKPAIILVSDVFTAVHSILDPHTEVIQIAGRFRNGFDSLTHITNFNARIESKSRAEGLQYLKGCFDTYDSIVTLLAKSKDEGSRDTLKFFVEHSPIAKYYDNNEVNQFMVDNYCYEERVKGYYQNPDNLKAGYLAVETHFKSNFIAENYLLSDEDRVNRESKTRIRDQQWEALRQIDRLTAKPKAGVITLSFSSELLRNLRSLYPWLTEAYDLLGMEGLKKTGLATSKINPAKARAKEIKELKKLAPFVYTEFDEHSEPSDSIIKSKMSELCAEAKVELNPTISLILKFFKGNRTTKSGIHVHSLKSKIDLAALTPFD